MRRNTRRDMVDTQTPVVKTPAAASDYERAVHFIRLGTLDMCAGAPYHQDYDRWPQKDQVNYESGRQHTGNLLQAAKPESRAQIARLIIQTWTEDIKGIPPDIERALGFANTTTGSAYPDKLQPNDPDVQAAVTRDVRGRMTFRIPTVLDT